MTAATTLATAPHPTDSATRGRTTVADKVIEKIAARAAVEVPHCVGLPRTVVGIATGGTAVQVDASRDGSVTGLSLRIGVEYPAPVVATTRRVRSHVSDVVHRLCDLTVDHVDIQVAALVHPETTERRVQ